MGSLVLDIFLVFFFKVSIRILHYVESIRWVRCKASFTNWIVIDPGWGCPSVRVHYELIFNESPFSGLDEAPFLTHWRAKTYAQSLSRDLHPIIRLNPKNPQQTRFFELDQ